MRSITGGFIFAAVLLGVAFMCWSEADLTRRMAAARQRLATVHYDENDRLDEPGRRVQLPLLDLHGDIVRHRATVSYWQAKYRELMARLPSAAGNNETAVDPNVLLLAANSSFRAAQADTSDRAATVERLDRVMQAYADVLRLSPGVVDASYNYEYVARFRDAFARARPAGARRAERPAPPAPPTDISPDLPTGPTIHGRPGAPPPDVPMERFRTITPMRFDEREEMDPGQGPPPRRRG
jgi:hypothetical protein